MYTINVFFVLLLAVPSLAHLHHPNHQIFSKRTLTPDNTCGNTANDNHGYTCDPSNSDGGSCCSAAGYCGNTAVYCGSGCQSAFGACGSSKSAPVPSATATPKNNPPSSTGRSPVPQKVGCAWVVEGAGSFTHSQVFNFSRISSVPAFLEVSTDTIGAGSSPYSQLYTKDNVCVKDGSLQLKVNGGQHASPISGSEISTSDKDIQFGSVRTLLEVSTVAGTCHGQFFYISDNEESDIEILTGDLGHGAHYTNQNLVLGGKSTTNTSALPVDVTTTMYEYRLDWLEDRTEFYLNGELQTTLKDNVPNTAGAWLWNNWSNGDPEWSAGPPKDDSIMKIGKIEMYYNTTGSPGACF